MVNNAGSKNPKIFIEREGMESHGLLVRFVRIFTVPMLNSLPPALLLKIIRKSSPYGFAVVERPGTTHSLEKMYTRSGSQTERGVLSGTLKKAADSFWHNIISQPKAVRNRLKIVERNIEAELSKIIKKKEEIDILNLGSGSSRALIHAISRFSGKGNFKIKITNVDKDAGAIELGKEIASKYGLQKIFSWVNDDVRNLRVLIEEESVDVAEMVGLLDYFGHDDSVKIIKQVYNILRKGGLFIVANVYPNSEMPFVRNVGWPKMHYKTEHELFHILSDAGFNEELTSITFEPLRVHIIGVARK